MVAGGPVDAALHGVNQQATGEGGLSDFGGKVEIGGNGRLLALSATNLVPRAGRCRDVTHRHQVAKALQGRAQRGGYAAGLFRVRGLHQIL